MLHEHTMEFAPLEVRQLEILIVESNPADARLVAEAFRDAGLTTTIPHLTSGDEVLPFLNREPPYENFRRPELIFLDLNLPGRSGLDVLKEIRANPVLACIPVIILSGSSDPGDIENTYRSGANCFIRKPTNLDDFWALIRSCYQFWGQSVCLPAPSENSR